jgi:hypothetical protein
MSSRDFCCMQVSLKSNILKESSRIRPPLNQIIIRYWLISDDMPIDGLCAIFEIFVHIRTKIYYIYRYLFLLMIFLSYAFFFYRQY